MRRLLPASALLGLLLITTVPVHAQKATDATTPATQTLRTDFGFSFRFPKEWKTKANEQGQVVVLPPDAKDEAYLVLFTPSSNVPPVDGPNAAAAYEAEIKKLMPQANRTGIPEKIATGCGRGLLLLWEGTDAASGSAVRAITVAIPYRDGAILLMGLGARDRVTAREKAFRELAASLTPDKTAAGKETDDSPATKQWRQRIGGRKLTYLSSINGGSSGGGSAQTVIRLNASGRFTYSRSSSVSINVEGASGSSSGQDAGAGAWRIISKDSQTFLELNFEGKPARRYALTTADGKTFLSGTRYFVTEL